ncbi:MAG: PLP-dependent aminotransferase family protein [Lachnospiraceae bacterium]|nr:PLP-dependent aminotransferase family protein [Lachnospiraceae bacterium]
MRDEKKYIKIYESLRDDILKGIYPYMSKLPSKRVTADTFGASLITVEHAYELLMEEDYIRPKERSGYFVSYEEGKILHASPAAKERFVKRERAEEGDSYRFPISVFAGTVRRILSEYAEEVLVKSPSQGCLVLREAIRDYLLRNRHIDVKTDQIIIGSGSEYLYGLIVQTFGRAVIYGIENPSYEKIAMIYRAAGVECDFLTLLSDGIRSSDLEKTEAKVLHITPYRSYPSGISATAAKKREYIRWAERKGGIIIEDDFESEFSPSRKMEETLFTIDKGKNVIYVNTFSKTVSSSLRVAYMVLPEWLTHLFEEKIGFYSCTVPTLDQYILAELIQNGDFERHINKVRRLKRAEGEGWQT